MFPPMHEDFVAFLHGDSFIYAQTATQCLSNLYVLGLMVHTVCFILYTAKHPHQAVTDRLMLRISVSLIPYHCLISHFGH